MFDCSHQWWTVTKYIYSSTALKYSFEILTLYFFNLLSLNISSFLQVRDKYFTFYPLITPTIVNNIKYDQATNDEILL